MDKLKQIQEELSEYLNNASKEQLEEDLKELEPFTKIGPLMEDYIDNVK